MMEEGRMYCSSCGKNVSEEAKFCNACGTPVIAKSTVADNRNLIGFSARINDPAFAKYIKQTRSYAWIFSMIIALAAVIGFFIYGETSDEMDNPQAVLIGCIIGSMFLIIALFSNLSRRKSTTWDGIIVDKKIEQKRRKQYTGEDDYYWQSYMVYTVMIRDNKGKVHGSSAENDDTVYNYYQINDRVRHHAGLNTYEKYDKSKDTIIFCNACGDINDINEEHCHRCSCPLLK
jgi:hypothetical protein